MTGAKAEELASWMLQATQSLDFGSVGVIIKVNAGRVVRIERTTMESEQQPDRKTGGVNDQRES